LRHSLSDRSETPDHGDEFNEGGVVSVDETLGNLALDKWHIGTSKLVTLFEEQKGEQNKHEQLPEQLWRAR